MACTIITISSRGEMLGEKEFVHYAKHAVVFCKSKEAVIDSLHLLKADFRVTVSTFPQHKRLFFMSIKGLISLD
jgi:hypothetical protein